MNPPLKEGSTNEFKGTTNEFEICHLCYTHNYSATNKSWKWQKMSCAVKMMCFNSVADIVHLSGLLFNNVPGILLITLLSLSNILSRYFVFHISKVCCELSLVYILGVL